MIGIIWKLETNKWKTLISGIKCAVLMELLFKRNKMIDDLMFFCVSIMPFLFPIYQS